MTVLVHSRAELAEALSEFPSGRLGLVPTMGALHQGHEALLQRAHRTCDAVIATIFVNPLQFGAGADLQKYPRALEADLRRCRQAQVDVVWAPSVSDVYPGGPGTVRISAGRFGADLEGADRPGHFDGVLTVVAKFLHAVRPEAAFFGEKDYQQLILINRMVTDLDFGVRIVGVPTVRDTDGLALSSRNVFLTAGQRLQALALSAALSAAQSANGGADLLLAEARAGLARTPGVDLHYLALRGPGLEPAPVSGAARLLIAATVGGTRLIDNVAVEVRPDE